MAAWALSVVTAASLYMWIERMAWHAGDVGLVMDEDSEEVGKFEGSLMSPAFSSVSAVVFLRKVKVSHDLSLSR